MHIEAEKLTLRNALHDVLAAPEIYTNRDDMASIFTFAKSR